MHSYFYEDRHYNNILFLYDDIDDTYKVSPIFDCGAGLMSDDRGIYFPKDVNVRSIINKVHFKPFSSSFIKQVTSVRELFGSQLKFKFDSVPVLITDVYEKRIVTRVNQLLRNQCNVWSDMLV